VEGDVAGLATFFFGAFEATEFEARAAKGCFAGDASGDQVVGVGIEVIAKLGVNLGFEAGAMANCAKPGTEAAVEGHGGSRGGHRIRRWARWEVLTVRRGARWRQGRASSLKG